MRSVSVYLIFGGDEYRVSAKAKEIIEKLVPPAEATLSLDTVDGRADTGDDAVRALSQCAAALRTPGFFGKRRVVWLRDAKFLADGPVAGSARVKSGVDDLTEMIKKGLPSETSFIVSSSKVDKRQSFYKTCAAAGEIHEFAVADKPYLAEKEAMGILRELSARSGLEMSPDVMGAFLEKVGTDTRRMAGELEKLAVYMGGRRAVELRDIEAVTVGSREAMAWDLADAVGRRDLAHAMELLRQLLFQGRKESPMGILMSLESRIRELMIYREALDKGWLRQTGGHRGSRADVEWGPVPSEVDVMMSKHLGTDPRGTHPYRAKLLAQQAMGFSMRELRQNHRRILATYEDLVSSAMPPRMAIEVLLMRMLGKKRS